MKKILIATDKPFAPVAVKGIRDIFSEGGYELALLEKYTSREQLLDAVKDVHAIIIRSDIIDAEIMDAAPALAIVVRAGAGYDNVDLPAATAHNVVVMNTPGQNANAVAELALGMMVYHARNLYNGSSGTELLGKSLGIHAYGAVGRRVGQIARGFGMEVYAFDPFIPGQKMEDDGVKPVRSREELYRNCQYISLHIPATDKTKRSIGQELLNSMPGPAVLVNTARKEVIDEEGLKQVMAARKDFAYLSDIAPDCAAELSEAYPGRVWFTPKKMGAQTAEANINAGLAAARQIRAFFEEGDRTFQVNR
ncbi:MAG TPA: 3-phosphoglycerate dehydrogenase [Bacteroidales bacterium]|nr:3-phosphoglycerate dehydrogenase [Bacteroidales bacterium]